MTTTAVPCLLSSFFVCWLVAIDLCRPSLGWPLTSTNVRVPSWTRQQQSRLYRFPPLQSTDRPVTTTTTTSASSATATTETASQEPTGTVRQLAGPSLDVLKLQSERAIRHAGTEEGLDALQELATMSAMRIPFEFDSSLSDGGTVLCPERNLLPQNVTDAMLDKVNRLCQQGCMSTNPDSVDGLPSLHLNLVAEGKSLFDDPSENTIDDDDDFQKTIREILALIRPYIYDRLLPRVQELVLRDNDDDNNNDSDDDNEILVSDVFLRRYGQDVIEGSSRDGISAHYDVYSIATSVVALDNVAASGTNGLYTTATTANGQTSNHASLRRYFPLSRGDAVLHTWDILHGVHVQPGLTRTSLIVWFSTKNAILDSSEETDTPESSKLLSPWLMKRNDLATNDVTQFVLASALESSSLDESDGPTGQWHRHELYLQSAMSGNSFAQTRIGSLVDEDELSPDMLRRVEQAVDGLDIPPDVANSVLVDTLVNDSKVRTARLFWLAAALQGNPLAQMALADDILVSREVSESQSLRVVAAVLYGMAAQQGLDDAAENLSHVVGVEIDAGSIQSEADFAASPVVQTAQAAMVVDDDEE